MVAITATNSSTVTLQSTLNSTRLAQARREADRAERQAEELREQLQQAEKDARKGKKNVQEISSRLQSSAAPATPAVRAQDVINSGAQSPSARIQANTTASAGRATAGNSESTRNPTYIGQLRSNSNADVPSNVQNFIERLYQATSPQFAASGNPLKTDADSAPVRNTQGQATGRILNLRA